MLEISSKEVNHISTFVSVYKQQVLLAVFIKNYFIKKFRNYLTEELANTKNYFHISIYKISIQT